MPAAIEATELFEDWRARSPFYDQTHEAVSQSVRSFVEREAAPHIEEWEQAGEVSRELHRKAGAAGVLGLGFPEEFGGTSERISVFHQLVKVEELARPGAGGFMAGLLTHNVALPPILLLGSAEMKERIAPAVIAGEKIMAIAVTEPSGGSDVARLKTRAERRGDRYVVNGSKIFITNGMRADYYLTAVRTGGEGMNGISLLLIEKGMKGFTQTRLRKMGWHSSDTAALYFDNL
jgi:acyl-CoA dehydrogenase